MGYNRSLYDPPKNVKLSYRTPVCRKLLIVDCQCVFTLMGVADVAHVRKSFFTYLFLNIK